MNRFFKKIIIIFIPIILLAYPLDIIISKQIKDTYLYTGEIEVWEDIYKNNIDVDIAIYGSSRAFLHINPEIIKDQTGLKAYNFGIEGNGFWIQYLRHEEYLKHNTKPIIIILNIDEFALAKGNDLHNYEQFLPYMLWNEKIKQHTELYEKTFSILDYYIPLIRYYGENEIFTYIIEKLILKRVYKKSRKNGFRGIEKEWLDYEIKVNKYKIEPDELSLMILEKFIQECKKSNIELFLVYTPEHIDGQDIVTNKDEINKIYLELINRYSIKYFDYSKNKICYDKSLFYNAMHLNKKGANIFTKIFINDLKTHKPNLFK